MRGLAVAIAASLLLPGCMSNREEEEEGEEAGTEQAVSAEGVPAAVREAALAAVPGLVVTAYTRETEDGQVFYEVSGTENGLWVDVVLTPAAEVVAVERTLAPGSVPAAIGSAAEKRLPGLVVSRAEKCVKKGVTTYELRGKVEGRVYEIVLSESGEVLEVED